MQVILAQPRGFCAGVERAIRIVEEALKLYGAPIYVRHEIVHNQWVGEELGAKGAIFVDELSQIPTGAHTIFSAHGVSSEVENEAKSRDFMYFDATCPLVTKVHLEVQKHAKKGRDIILIGHKGHPEVVGTLGRHPKDSGTNIYLIETREDIDELEVKSDSLAYVNQTTLSIDDTKNIIEILKKKFPNIKSSIKEDICYATTNRQNAVKQIAGNCDMFFVIGSENSSNSKRLVEVAKKSGCKKAELFDFSKKLPKS